MREELEEREDVTRVIHRLTQPVILPCQPEPAGLLEYPDTDTGLTIIQISQSVRLSVTWNRLYTTTRFCMLRGSLSFMNLGPATLIM